MTTVVINDAANTVVVNDSNGDTAIVTAPSTAVTVTTTGLGPQGPGGVLGLYANIIDTTDQSLISTSASQVITFNTLIESKGVTLSNGSRINFPVAGTYKILASLQVTNSSNNISEVNIFFKKNGTTLADSNTRIDLDPRKSIATPYHACFTIEYQITVDRDDYIQIAWSADHLEVALDTIPSNALHPAAPSAIINVAQVMYTQTSAVPRSITIANPVVNDNFTLFRTEASTTISNVLALVRGTTPSVTFVLKAGPDRNAVGTAITVSEAITNTTTGESVAIVNQPIATGYYVWLEITAVSGAVSEFNVSIEI